MKCLIVQDTIFFACLLYYSTVETFVSGHLGNSNNWSHGKAIEIGYLRELRFAWSSVSHSST